MSRIHILDDRLVSQIAAGEVVERPSSVVKELVENALDAGAREIRVELVAGGKRRIVVADDGCGMDADDALLAFDRHATSKIDSIDDLERVATLGFRGEALSSIAAVARVELRTAETAGEGQRVRIEGGRVVTVEPVAHPQGTRLEVASLFFNVPARRKFLKRPQTELRHALAVIQGYALAQPEVRFSLRHDGRMLLETLPVSADQEGLRARIGQIFGAVLARNLIPLEAAVRPGERVAGFVGNRQTGRGRRLFVYVNRRLVRDRALLAIFYRTVRETWKSDAFPALFLFLEVPPEEVDVNVHPQKAEVRFRDPGFAGRVGDALRAALEQARGEEPAPLATPVAPPSMPAAWEGLGERKQPLRDDGGTWRPLPGGEVSEVREGAVAGGDELADGGARSYGRTVEPGPAAGVAPRIAQPNFTPPAPRTVPLSGRSGPPRAFRLLGQYKGSLILLEGPDGLYLIDQHVAHERLLYERLRRAFADESTPSQSLIEPQILELGPAEALRLSELAPALEPCGFALRPLSGGAVALAALPADLALDAAERLLQRLATAEEAIENDPGALRRQLLDDFAASQSCRAAVKMHHPLTMDEMQALISELFRAEQPYACPHGRPVVLQMTDVELERRFGRR